MDLQHVTPVYAGLILLDMSDPSDPQFISQTPCAPTAPSASSSSIGPGLRLLTTSGSARRYAQGQPNLECYLCAPPAIYMTEDRTTRGGAVAELALTDTMQPTPTDGDAWLVQEAQRRPAAFAQLYRRYVGPVHRYVYSRVGNRADAEDLTAEVFTAALRGLPAYRERGAFAGWLFSIARRTVAGHHRRARPTAHLDDLADPPALDPDPLARVLADETSADLARQLARLDEEQRELLRLRYAAGLTYRAIGEVLGKREAAVKMAVHRLLARLHDEWEVDHAR